MVRLHLEPSPADSELIPFSWSSAMFVLVPVGVLAELFLCFFLTAVQNLTAGFKTSKQKPT